MGIFMSRFTHHRSQVCMQTMAGEPRRASRRILINLRQLLELPQFYVVDKYFTHSLF